MIIKLGRRQLTGNKCPKIAHAMAAKMAMSEPVKLKIAPSDLRDLIIVTVYRCRRLKNLSVRRTLNIIDSIISKLSLIPCDTVNDTNLSILVARKTRTNLVAFNAEVPPPLDVELVGFRVPARLIQMSTNEKQTMTKSSRSQLSRKY